jgi:hypothetical protein
MMLLKASEIPREIDLLGSCSHLLTRDFQQLSDKLCVVYQGKP